MKTRQGFVSNSSSSSFIIAIKKDANKCEHCGRSDLDLLSVIEGVNEHDDDNQVDRVGAEAIIYETEKHWYDKTKSKKIIEKIEEYSRDKTWQIAEISISYHNNMLNTLIENMAANGTIKIINKDG